MTEQDWKALVEQDKDSQREGGCAGCSEGGCKTNCPRANDSLVFTSGEQGTDTPKEGAEK